MLRTAQHNVTGQLAVVKLINSALAASDQNATERFSEEIKTLGRVQGRHRNIINILDGGVHTDPPELGGASVPYFAMEYVHGVPISVYKTEQTPDLPELLEKFCQACDAIDDANTLQVIHCDLKPLHILIDSNGLPRVLDFGLARLLDPSVPREARPLLAGTPAYMSPEQVTDEFGEIGPWTDVYALGIILFELLAGRRPYDVPRGPLAAISKCNPRSDASQARRLERQVPRQTRICSIQGDPEGPSRAISNRKGS